MTPPSGPSQTPPPPLPPPPWPSAQGQPSAPPGYPGGYGYPPPPPHLAPGPRRPDPARRWLIIGVVVLVVGFLAYVIATGVRVFSEGFGPPRDVTTNYFAALKAHDWQTAHGYLAPSLRAANTPADLERTWLRREQANGTLDRFAAGNINVRSFNGVTTATVAGTLHYAGGVNDPKIITLVREGDQWKFATVP